MFPGSIMPRGNWPWPLFGKTRRGQSYPADGTAFTAATGLTADAIYLFNEDSGNLIDAAGANDLTAGATPTFNSVQSGRRGIYYDAAGDYHRADVLAAGADPFLFGIVACFTENPAASRFFGTRRFTGASPEASYGIWVSAASNGRPIFDLRDGTSTVLVSAPASIDIRSASSLSVPHLIIGQRDNAASVARVFVYRPGQFLGQAEGSIAGLGSLDTASQVFGFGTPLSNAGDKCWLGYSFVIRGVAANGATTPPAIAKALGWV